MFFLETSDLPLNLFTINNQGIITLTRKPHISEKGRNYLLNISATDNTKNSAHTIVSCILYCKIWVALNSYSIQFYLSNLYLSY